MQIGAVFQPGFRCRCGVTNGSPMLWGAAFGRTLGHWTTPGVTTRLRGRLCLGCGSVYMDMPEQGSRFSWGASPFVSGFCGWAVGPLCARWAELRVRRVPACCGQRFLSVRCILAWVCVAGARPPSRLSPAVCVCVCCVVSLLICFGLAPWVPRSSPSRLLSSVLSFPPSSFSCSFPGFSGFLLIAGRRGFCRRWNAGRIAGMRIHGWNAFGWLERHMVGLECPGSGFA